MVFFRSEEHLRNWAQFDPAKIEGIISLPDLVRLFSGNYFKRRMDSDYFPNMLQYMGEMAQSIQNIENAGAFWKL